MKRAEVSFSVNTLLVIPSFCPCTISTSSTFSCRWLTRKTCNSPKLGDKTLSYTVRYLDYIEQCTNLSANGKLIEIKTSYEVTKGYMYNLAYILFLLRLK